MVQVRVTGGLVPVSKHGHVTGFTCSRWTPVSVLMVRAGLFQIISSDEPPAALISAFQTRRRLSCVFFVPVSVLFSIIRFFFGFSFPCDFHAALTEAGGCGLMPFAAAESCVPHLRRRWCPSGWGWIEAAWLCQGGCGQVVGLKPLLWRDVPGFPSFRRSSRQRRKIPFFLA